MTAQEVAQQEIRIEKFKFLDAARSALRSTHDKMGSTTVNPGGVQSHDDPFTGNTRESRRIISLKIEFSATLGGEAPTNLNLDYLNIPAWELGRSIEELINKRLAQLNAEIEKL